MKKGTKEELVKEQLEELNTVLVSFNGKENVYEFENAIISGKLKGNEEDEVSSIFSGFANINDFVLNYNNIILQATKFLIVNSENDAKFVIQVLKNSVNELFEMMEDGEFDLEDIK